MTTRLFVYGTLMRGEHHHETLAGARFVGSARTCAVSGELYDVSSATLAALDELEDVPALYLREQLVGDSWDEAAGRHGVVAT